MSSTKTTHNVLITFVSKDLNLNRIGITELVRNKKHGGLSKVYLLFDGREKNSQPQDGWAQASVKNKNELQEWLKQIITVEPIPVDPNNVVDKIKSIIQKESDSGNTIFLDATSFRRITIPRLTLLSLIRGVKLYLVVPEPSDLYDLKQAYVKEGGTEMPLDEWASKKQAGKFELLDIPTICPKLNKMQKEIVKKLKSSSYDSLKSLQRALGNDEAFKKPSLRSNLRKLKQLEIINYEKDGAAISKIELASFGKLVSDIIKDFLK